MIYIYAYCTDENGRFPAGDSTIKFTDQAPSPGVTVEDLGTQYGERCAIVTAFPPERGALPPTVTVIVSAGNDGLIQAPVTLTLQQVLWLVIEMVNGNRTPSKQKDFPVFDAWEHKEEHSWNPGELVVHFRGLDSEEPVYPGFMPLYEIFPSIPDYLDIPPLVTDDNLTWRTHPKLKPSVKIPPDWLNKDGVIIIKIRCTNMPKEIMAVLSGAGEGATGVAGAAGSADIATMGYYLAPILELRYRLDTDANQTRSYLGVTLKSDQFVTDSIDELGIIYYVHNSADSDIMSVATEYDIEDIEFTLTDEQKKKFTLNEDATFQHPGQKRYTMRATTTILYTDEIISDSSLSPCEFSTRAEIQPNNNMPKFVPPLELTVDTTVIHGYIYLKLWVVPGKNTGTSEASCYACMAPNSSAALIGLPLTLAVENVGIGGLALSDPEQQMTNATGLSSWVLQYSGLTWENYNMAGFTVKCGIPDGQNPPLVATEVIFNISNNVSSLVRDIFTYQDNPALNLNNPLCSLEGISNWRKAADYVIPDVLSGPSINIASLVLTAKINVEPQELTPYICGNYSTRIYEWMLTRRFGRIISVDPDTLLCMNGIDLNEYSMWSLGPITHHFAGFHLSGADPMEDPRFIDPWWRQDWKKKEYLTLDGMMTINSERLCVGIMVGSIVVVAVMVSALCMALAFAVSSGFVLILLRTGAVSALVEMLTVRVYGVDKGDFEDDGSYMIMFRKFAYYHDKTPRRWDRDAVEEFFRGQFPEVPPITGYRTW